MHFTFSIGFVGKNFVGKGEGEKPEQAQGVSQIGFFHMDAKPSREAYSWGKNSPTNCQLAKR